MARTWQEILREHQSVAEQMGSAAAVLDAMAEALAGSLRGGGRVLVLGNGGSAADAQHIAGELVGRFKRERRALAAIALSADSSVVTAVANDLGFERVYARQVEALARPGDVVWILSTSGRSANVLAAARAAREIGAVVIGFTGARGEELAALCDHVLRVPHESSDRIQEGHILAYHYLCERVEGALG